MAEDGGRGIAAATATGIERYAHHAAEPDEDRWDLLTRPANSARVLLPGWVRDLAKEARVGLPPRHGDTETQTCVLSREMLYIAVPARALRAESMARRSVYRPQRDALIAAEACFSRRPVNTSASEGLKATRAPDDVRVHARTARGLYAHGMARGAA